MMKAKQKELDRLAEFGAYETVDLQVALRKIYNALGAGPQKRRNQSTIRPKGVQERRNITHTFIADVTNAYFHVDDQQ